MDKQLFSKWTARACALLMIGASVLGVSPAAHAATEAPTSDVDAYVLADFDTGEILLSKDADKRLEPASTTKLMTALLLVENKADLSEKVTVGAEVNPFPKGSSLMGLEEHETLSLMDLLYGAMLPSGNDAAAAIAVAVGGDMDHFIEMMNQRAQELGMTGTHYVNPHGLTTREEDEEHYTTAADMRLLTIAALSNETIAKVLKTPSYQTSPTNKHPNGFALQTTNKLISEKENDQQYNYRYAIGGKTGVTTAAGGCLCAAAEKGDRKLVAVILGDHSLKGTQKYYKRWTDSAAFFDYGFTLQRVDLTEKVKAVSLTGTPPGSEKDVQLVPQYDTDAIAKWVDSDTAATLGAADAQVTASIEWDESLASPAPEGNVLGQVVYKIGDTEIYRCNVTQKVEAKQTPASDGEGGANVFLIILLVVVGLLLLLLILRMVLVAQQRKRARMRRRSRYLDEGPRRNNLRGRRLPDPYDLGRQRDRHHRYR